MAGMIALCSWFQHLFPGVKLTELRQKLAVAFGGVRHERSTPDQEPDEVFEEIDDGTSLGDIMGREGRYRQIQEARRASEEFSW